MNVNVVTMATNSDQALARPEDIYAPIPDNDDYHLPEAEPFPNLEQREGPRPPQQSSPSGDEREPEQQDAAQAALGRRPRTKKPLARDEVLEMSTSGLYGNHLNKMQDAKALKRRKAATLEAKRNANNWAMSFGMGGVGVALGRAKLRSPLSAVFSGLPAVDFFRGAGQNESRQKRSRDRDDEAESDRLSKRVRADQGEAEEVGRGVSPLMQDDDILMLPDSGVRVSISAYVLRLMKSRISRLDVTHNRRWRTHHFHGTPPRLLDLAMAQFLVAEHIQQAWADFPPVSERQALYMAWVPIGPAQSTDERAASPAPVL